MKKAIINKTGRLAVVLVVAMLATLFGSVASPPAAEASGTTTLTVAGAVYLDISFTPVVGATVVATNPATGAVVDSVVTDQFGSYELPYAEVTCSGTDLTNFEMYPGHTVSGCFTSIDPVVVVGECPSEFPEVIEDATGCYELFAPFIPPLCSGAYAYSPEGTCKYVEPFGGFFTSPDQCPLPDDATVIVGLDSEIPNGLGEYAACVYAPLAQAAQCSYGQLVSSTTCRYDFEITTTTYCTDGVLMADQCLLEAVPASATYYEISAGASSLATQTVDGATLQTYGNGLAHHDFFLGGASPAANGVSQPGGNGTQLFPGEITSIAYNACPGAGTASLVVLDSSSTQVASETLIEGPTGLYTGSTGGVPAPGLYTLTITVQCPAGGTDTETFDLDYLDPSGQVFDCQGNPIEGVEVTLWRADNATDPLVMVPDGSTIMSPDNRANPSFTTATGYYRWDTTPGWYQVRATIPFVGTVSSERLVVPPERTEVNLTFDTINCAVPTGGTPTTNPPATDPATTTPTATTPTTTTPTTSTTTTPTSPTTTTRRAILIEAPAPDPIEGEIVNGALGCSFDSTDGESTLRVEIPAALEVWFDRTQAIAVSAPGARYRGEFPTDRVVEMDLSGQPRPMTITLKSTLITGAAYTVRCTIDEV